MDEFDVVVLGTGAAGLTAALAAARAGASVALFDEGNRVGGTTCLSSGVAWLPANPLAARAGIADSREEGLARLGSLSRGLILPELAEAFVDTVGKLVAWLEEHTPLQLQLIAPCPDHHPEHPGGEPGGGRSVEPELFPVPRLGACADRLVGAVRRSGVVLATGGFEWDAGLVRDFLRGPIAHPASVPTNTDDDLPMAMRVGAAPGTMREAWWAPVPARMEALA